MENEYQVTGKQVVEMFFDTVQKWAQRKHAAIKQDIAGLEGEKKEYADNIDIWDMHKESVERELTRIKEHEKRFLSDVEPLGKYFRIAGNRVYKWGSLDDIKPMLKEPVLTEIIQELEQNNLPDSWTVEYIREQKEKALFDRNSIDVDIFKVWCIRKETASQLINFRNEERNRTYSAERDRIDAKENTAKGVIYPFFDTYIGDENSKFAVLRVGLGKGKQQPLTIDLWKLFMSDCPDFVNEKNKNSIKRDSFFTYLSKWRGLKRTN